MHAGHAQVTVVRIGYGTLAHEGRHDGDVHIGYDVLQRRCHIGQNDAATGENDRFFCCFDGGDGPVEIVFLAGNVAVVASQLYCAGIGKVKGRIKNVFGDVYENRARPACRSDIEGFLQDAGQLFFILDQVVMLGNGCSDAGNIRFLEGVPSNECRCDLAADDDQGNGIHIGCGNTRNHIADARAGCGKANAGLARCPGVAISGVDGALFVTRQDMRKFFFIHFVVERKDSTARIAEDDVYAFVLQTGEYCLSTC